MGNSVHAVNTLIPSPHTGQASAPVHSLIYDRAGNRKYLTAAERRRFLRAVADMPPEQRTFCLVLSYSGARISEVLALTAARFDSAAHLVVVESLKKRQSGVFRAIPLPADVFDELERVHHLTDLCRQPGRGAVRLWPWCRTVAWLRIKQAMTTAHLDGPKAVPKGLRHGFAVTALQGGVPISQVKRWLGHARLSTTELYAEAVGAEEKALAKRLWGTF
jgi:integrase/recombinase XerD